MEINKKQQVWLRMLPGVDRILEIAGIEPTFEDIPKSGGNFGTPFTFAVLDNPPLYIKLKLPAG